MSPRPAHTPLRAPPQLPPRAPRPPTPPTPEEERALTRQRRKTQRERLLVAIGIGLLIAGYALLAVSPDTPSEWVLIRVAAGFGLLFGGFGFAVMPWLSNVSRGEE